VRHYFLAAHLYRRRLELAEHPPADAVAPKAGRDLHQVYQRYIGAGLRPEPEQVSDHLSPVLCDKAGAPEVLCEYVIYRLSLDDDVCPFFRLFDDIHEIRGKSVSDQHS
jgi:hypothetical protein